MLTHQPTRIRQFGGNLVGRAGLIVTHYKLSLAMPKARKIDPVTGVEYASLDDADYRCTQLASASLASRVDLAISNDFNDCLFTWADECTFSVVESD